MGAKDQGAEATEGRWLVIPRTLCFVTHGDDVLLLRRAAHKRVYPGLYNGVGGHLERDEDPLTGAVREVQEETGLDLRDVRFCGAIHVDAGASNGILVFVFQAEAASRDLASTDEGTLEWVPRSRLADFALVEDLPLLLDIVLDSKPGRAPFFAHTSYTHDDQLLMLFASPSLRARD